MGVWFKLGCFIQQVAQVKQQIVAKRVRLKISSHQLGAHKLDGDRLACMACAWQWCDLHVAEEVVVDWLSGMLLKHLRASDAIGRSASLVLELVFRFPSDCGSIKFLKVVAQAARLWAHDWEFDIARAFTLGSPSLALGALVLAHGRACTTRGRAVREHPLWIGCALIVERPDSTRSFVGVLTNTRCAPLDATTVWAGF
mmetsp:Transcript_8351/g.14021  ORF Transcript_8351/g.14021 Transcript_8351/m.14021 type:complete len:199 (-) Transcript_8351:548-1144(-)